MDGFTNNDRSKVLNAKQTLQGLQYTNLLYPVPIHHPLVCLQFDLADAIQRCTIFVPIQTNARMTKIYVPGSHAALWLTWGCRCGCLEESAKSHGGSLSNLLLSKRAYFRRITQTTW